MFNVKDFFLMLGVMLLITVSLLILPREVHWFWVSNKDEKASYESFITFWHSGRYIEEASERYDEQLWDEAQAANSIQGYRLYAQLSPEGNHLSEAKERIGSLRGERVIVSNNIQEVEAYLQLYPQGKYADEANERIDTLRWRDATTTNTVRSYKDYITEYPQGQYLEQAKERISGLRSNDAPFEEAVKKGTETSLQQFLEDFPGHKKEPYVKQAIKDIFEGRNIVDLLKEKKIEVETQGSGIQNVKVRMRNLATYPITVRIPVGSYFISSRQSSQNMITTAESKVRLTGDGWRSVSVSAACANMPRDIPGSEDTFTIQRSPYQEELARLMPVLDKAGENFATRQAAVWIVTDDASYADLGNLVSRPAHSLFGGTRMIREADVTRAMKLCAEVGIDIKSKSIWRDRQRILNGLEDGELKTWLEQN